MNARFWAKVSKSDDCWNWIGAKNNKGYGQFNVGGITKLAHRIGWEIQGASPPPENLCVLHKCDNPACIRADHLFIGTRSDNMKDCTQKGRNYKPNKLGERPCCVYGHAFTDKNTYWYGNTRQCRSCRAKRERARQKRLKETRCK